MPVSEYNPLVEFVVITDPLINLNDATKLVVHVLIGNTVMLKFDKTGSAGYDGTVDVNSVDLNKCSVVATVDQAEKIKVGDLKAEFECIIPFPGYPAGGRKIKAVAVLQKITFATTIK